MQQFCVNHWVCAKCLCGKREDDTVFLTVSFCKDIIGSCWLCISPEAVVLRITKTEVSFHTPEENCICGKKAIKFHLQMR